MADTAEAPIGRAHRSENELPYRGGKATQHRGSKAALRA